VNFLRRRLSKARKFSPYSQGYWTAGLPGKEQCGGYGWYDHDPSAANLLVKATLAAIEVARAAEVYGKTWAPPEARKLCPPKTRHQPMIGQPV